MFLKRIEMQGFKSFADKTNIEFDHAITGIVGPNGCGKSNISDSVRWVLGEQSAKSMRGEKMHDVIFSGSADRRKMNLAEVTLVFDNSNHILNTEQEDVEITRRLYRDSGDAEYLVNRNRVRLKDVVELFLDTGLGKDSLSIISQGNIISFAESKPHERRAIFEEAAGVAKYKKRKIESLSRLERTKDNLDRSHDILMELEKQVSPLKRQARKAELYKEKKDRLEEIEIAVLVQEIEELTNRIAQGKKTLFDIESHATMLETGIQVDEAKIQQEKRNTTALDQQVTQMQTDLLKLVDVIASLEARKTEMDERRKYIIETGNREQKANETKRLLEVAKTEYEDRKERLDKLNVAIELDSEKMKQIAQVVFDATTEKDRASMLLRSLTNKKQQLEGQLKDPLGSKNAGARAIMQNQNALVGILGVVGQVLKADDGYEQAISEALGGAMFNIVTRDDQSARNAIRFLDKNESGRATFLPLSVLKPRYVNDAQDVICNNFEGFLGYASEFVDCDEIYDPVVDSLLQNIAVTENLKQGNDLSRLLDYKVQIVTLNGEVIHRGGSMTGGKNKHRSTPLTLQKELKDLNASIDAQSAKEELASKHLEEAETKRHAISSALQENRIAAARLEPVVDAKQAKYEKLKNDLALLNPDDLKDVTSGEEVDTDTIKRLNDAYSKRDEITSSIKSNNEERFRVNSDIDRKELKVRQDRKEYQRLIASSNAIKVDQGRLETKIETNLQRLASEYQLTYEFAQTKVSDETVENAKQEVLQLRAEIDRLGNVNMNAPVEYEEVNTRYEFLKKQIAELEESRDKILNAIDQMDRVMTKQFKEMFDMINHEFNEIFTNLYGGGKARLILVDPEDILNTGIDIDAQPPGKAVQNNMLFSGGEKSLIALCVLFAILKVKPVPLVILDEVEAALDPSNVERFAQYLHNYTNQTQFIVVTHRQGTMENCNVLYGVTMQKQGVSQMLKVEMKEAVEFAEGH